MFARKILVPLDLSTEGERALAPAAELARAIQATLVILHVVENVGVAPVGERAPKPSYLPGTTQEIERARAELEKRKKALAGVTVETEVVVAPSVPHAISDYAVEKRCGFIALSTHGRSGFRRLIMGSVAEAVLRSARVPVLVFPRPE